MPVIPGHQAVGEVAARSAPGSRTGRIGERAGTTWLAGFDGTCRFCLTGRENLCQSAVFTGWDRMAVLPTPDVRADVAVRIPDAIDDVAAAPLLCGGVIGYRALRLSGIQPGADWGCTASEHRPARRSRWPGSGAATSMSRRARAAILKRAVALGASPLVATTIHRPSTRRRHHLRAGRFGGRVRLAGARPRRAVVVNAIHLDGIPAFSYDDLWWERSIRSVANVTRRDAMEFLDLAARSGSTSRWRSTPWRRATRHFGGWTPAKWTVRRSSFLGDGLHLAGRHPGRT